MSGFKNNFSEKDFSFTLAEVLITLVVIGIIAAVTVPVIMANHKKTETVAKLKKFYSTFSNAVRLSEIDHGVPSPQWEYRIYGNDTYEEFFNEYLSKYLSYSKIDHRCLYSFHNQGQEDEYFLGPIDWMKHCVYLNDGSILSFIEGISGVVIDINGEEGPNEAGRDIFTFAFPTQEVIDSYTEKGIKVQKFGINSYYTKEQYIEGCAQSYPWHDPDPAWACAYVLVSDGWEFTSNYKKRL